jgi:dihydrofolate reductase
LGTKACIARELPCADKDAIPGSSIDSGQSGSVALELARESTCSRDIRIAGGADVIQQYLSMDIVDELEIALAHVLFGGGRRLFENLGEPGPQFRIDRVLEAARGSSPLR